MTRGEQFLEDRRQRRRAGDPNLTDADREVLRRLTTGDLADEFGAALAEVSNSDPLLSGSTHPDV